MMRLISSLFAAGLVVVSATRGIDVAGMNPTVKPGDDFFQYANGTWDGRTSIPPDRAAWGIDAELDEQATAHTRALLENAAARGANERKASAYYAAYMDEAAIETRGLSPLAPTLARVEAIADGRALAQELGARLRADV